MKSLDVTGLSCPEPAIRARAALQNLQRGEQMEILADTATARENILRAGRAMECTVSVETDGGHFKLIVTKNG